MYSRRDLLDKYTNKHSKFVVVRGSLLHYRDEGEGMPLILLHGAFSSLHTFNSWTEILKEHYRVIRIDLPGLGLSDPPHWDSDYGLDIYQKHILEFLKILNIDKCFIAGSSLGGWIAWELVLRAPQKFAKLVLVGAAGFLDARSVPTPFLMARTPFADKIAQFAIKKKIIESFLKQVYVDDRKVGKRLVERYYDLFSKEGNPETFFKLVNGKFKDHTNKLKKIKIPTLIIWGEHDAWLPLDNAFKFKDAIPHADLVIYDDLGHIPMEEAPDATAEDIINFLGFEVKLALRA